MAKAKKVASGKKRGGKKSKAESVTEAKANEVEVRTVVGIGDNSQLALPAPDDYAHHMKTIKGYMDKLETAKSILSHAKTAANKACPGLAASIAETLKFEREGDPIKLQKRLEMLGMGLKQIGSTIQLSVFDSLAGDEMDMVYQRGLADGKAGKTPDCRYPEGSDLAEQYNAGWRHGTAENMGVSAADADAAVAEASADADETIDIEEHIAGQGETDGEGATLN